MGIVAALVAGIVLVAGLAAALFLVAEGRGGAAAIAIILSVSFSALIATLVPLTRVTLYDGERPALTITQKSRAAFPSTTYAVVAPDGNTLALLRRSLLSRLGRNRWTIATPPDHRGVAYAIEESLGRALLRKFIGKFSRRHEANVRIIYQDKVAGEIIRRPEGDGSFDVLRVHADGGIDRRVAIALATLIFGAEP